jgi:catechol 2,3-dioxygenase-like lactoylglutathione lyase family enzyme
MESNTVPQLCQVVLDSMNPRAAAEFWRQLLGLKYRDGHEPPPAGFEDPMGQDWLNLITTSGEPCLAFQWVAELSPSTWPDARVPQQLHVDLSVRSVEELNEAHVKITSLGGKLRLDRSDSVEEPLRVYADLDGHPFCVFVVEQS